MTVSGKYSFQFIVDNIERSIYEVQNKCNRICDQIAETEDQKESLLLNLRLKRQINRNQLPTDHDSIIVLTSIGFRKRICHKYAINKLISIAQEELEKLNDKSRKLQQNLEYGENLLESFYAELNKYNAHKDKISLKIEIQQKIKKNHKEEEILEIYNRGEY